MLNRVLVDPLVFCGNKQPEEREGPQTTALAEGKLLNELSTLLSPSETTYKWDSDNGVS